MVRLGVSCRTTALLHRSLMSLPALADHPCLPRRSARRFRVFSFMQTPPSSTVPSSAKRRGVPWSVHDGFMLGVLAAGMAIGVRQLYRERQAVQREIEARAEAQRSAKARAALLGMVSHELRTPLQTLLVNVDMLAGLGKGEDVDELAARMARALELMSSKLNNLAQYARLASGADVVRNETIQLADVLSGIVESHADRARQRRQAITLVIDDHTPLTVQGDGVRLLQIVDNYVANALKYVGEGSITVRCGVTHHDVTSSEVIEVCVIDNGPGIPDVEKDRIWEPYYRGVHAPGRVRGSGLGLAVVKLLASSAGWKVGVRSSRNGGATFYVWLPIAGSGDATSQAGG
jgi:signal transduction histidine kinase